MNMNVARSVHRFIPMMGAMAIRQAFVTSLDDSEVLTTWLDMRPGLRLGVVITLDGHPGKRWLVAELPEVEHDPARFRWHRRWAVATGAGL